MTQQSDSEAADSGSDTLFVAIGIGEPLGTKTSMKKGGRLGLRPRRPGTALAPLARMLVADSTYL